MLTKTDIDLLKSELVPAVSDAVQKKLENKLNTLATKDKLSRVEKKVDKLDTRLNTVEQKVNKIDTRLGSVEQKVDELSDFLVPAIGNILEWTDDIHRAIVGRPARRIQDN